MMSHNVKQDRISVTDGDVVGRDKITHIHSQKTKLSQLFDKLKDEFDNDSKTSEISDDYKRYVEQRDIVGLEQKLIDGDREDLIEDALWLKQEYSKKLTKFQFFEPAQEIHAYLLGIVLGKFRNLIYPKMRSNSFSEVEISEIISNQILDPIVNMIQEQGCNDIMGLNSTDIEGMIYFLTGHCHIKWYPNDSISPGF